MHHNGANPPSPMFPGVYMKLIAYYTEIILYMDSMKKIKFVGAC